MNEPVRKVWADFNGLFGDVLCLGHHDTLQDERGDLVELREGMVITAFDETLMPMGIQTTSSLEPWHGRLTG
jgi:hypothetical protein